MTKLISITSTSRAEKGRDSGKLVIVIGEIIVGCYKISNCNRTLHSLYTTEKGSDCEQKAVEETSQKSKYYKNKMIET